MSHYNMSSLRFSKIHHTQTNHGEVEKLVYKSFNTTQNGGELVKDFDWLVLLIIKLTLEFAQKHIVGLESQVAFETPSPHFNLVNTMTRN